MEIIYRKEIPTSASKPSAPSLELRKYEKGHFHVSLLLIPIHTRYAHKIWAFLRPAQVQGQQPSEQCATRGIMKRFIFPLSSFPFPEYFLITTHILSHMIYRTRQSQSAQQFHGLQRISYLIVHSPTGPFFSTSFNVAFLPRILEIEESPIDVTGQKGRKFSLRNLSLP